MCASRAYGPVLLIGMLGLRSIWRIVWQGTAVLLSKRERAVQKASLSLRLSAEFHAMRNCATVPRGCVFDDLPYALLRLISPRLEALSTPTSGSSAIFP
ncbi:hypothetical protein BKA83DRAFT_4179257 [Pisolithus microcarpus]|nr:hypothetical protein BKA83DRAFT_4179257 [Pisolithus microcarpus]